MGSCNGERFDLLKVKLWVSEIMRKVVGILVVEDMVVEDDGWSRRANAFTNELPT